MSKLIIILIIIAAVGSIFGLMVTETWNPSWNPFGENSQGILEKSLAKNVLAKTQKTEGNLTLVLNNKEIDSTFTVGLNFSGGQDQKDSQNQKGFFDFDLIFETGGMEISSEGELRRIGDDFYLKLGSIPILPLLGIPMTELEDEWILIENKDIEEEGAIKKEQFQQFFQEIKNALSSRRIFLFSDNLGEEKVRGEDCYHYLVELNKEELKTLIPQLLENMEKYIPQSQKEEYQEKLDEALENFSAKFDQFSQQIGRISFEVWIDKNEDYFRRIKGEKEIDLSLFESFQETEAKDILLDSSFDIYFFDFGKPVEVEVPEDAKNINELMSTENIFNSSLFENLPAQ